MDAAELHRDALLIDGLIISRWSRSVFEDMALGGVNAANCTCSVWEGFRDTMRNIARWKAWIDENDDLLTPVMAIDDIPRAKAEGRVGIILGWQNTSAIEDRIEYLRLFRDLGVRVMQLTYNTQNLVGSGCWEGRDGGLSDFGRDVIDEMNRLGILIDLSHVGPRTSEDAIAHSKVPLAYTHCCPSGLRMHPRNKSDDQLRAIVARGGFVGVATYPPFLPKGAQSTVDDCVEAFAYVVDLVGEDHVGIGTDFTQGQGPAFFEWLRADKGDGRSLAPGMTTDVTMPIGFERIADYPNLTAAMLRCGWSEARVRKIMGENWLRFLGEVWNS